MRKLMFSSLLSGVLFIAGFALFIFVGKHVFATPNATGGADSQTKDRASKRAVSFENGAVLILEGAPEDVPYWDLAEPGAKIATGANANAVLSLDLIADGGSGNQRDDGVTTGTVSGQGTTIAVEVFAKGVTTSLRGVILKFEFDASLLSYVKAENSAFPLAIPDASVGTNLAATAPVTLAASGFLARAEFETFADVTGREFAIGIESVTLAESSASEDELSTTSEISFNAAPSPDFDGDGTVGFSDFIAFASKFGTRRGDAAYDARFDLDGDGETGFSDFLAFASQFGTTVGTPPPSGSPDLIVESPSVNDNTLTTGQSFTLRATVRNQGNASAAATTLRYYRSSNATISTDDVEVGTDVVSSLSAGGTSAESISLNAPSSTGTYYYGACVDGVSGESNADNNCSSGARVTVTQTTPSGFAPAHQQAFNSLVVGNRIRAESHFFDFESAGRFKEGFRRHEGSYTYSHTGANTGTFTHTFDEGLYGGRCVSSLTFTSTTTGTLTRTCDNNGIPSDMESWQISDLTTPILVRTAADTLHIVFLDTRSAQQTRAYDFAIRQKTTPQEDWKSTCRTFSNRTDNSITGYNFLSVISSRFLPNTTWETRYRYRNSSSCNTGSPGPWSPIAENTTPGSGTGGGGGSGNTYGVGESLPNYPSGFFLPRRISRASISRSGGRTVLSFQNGGQMELQNGTTYTCIAAQGCSIEGGRVTAGTIRVTGSSGGGSGSPDLMVDAPSVSDNTLMTGQSFNLEATVRNRGNGSSAATTLRYYRSTNATISSNDTEVGSDTVDGLAASATSAESISLNAPSSTGTYYYGACVDNVSGESNTGNNCSAAVSITVAAVTPPGTRVSKLYWTDIGTDKIQRSNLDGSDVEDLVTTGLSLTQGIALDVSGGKMYWTDGATDKIQRSNLDGSDVEDLVTSGLDAPAGIALDVVGGKMYWTDWGTGKIQRSNLDGSGVEDLVTSGLRGPTGIALDVSGGKMYWTDPGHTRIQRSNLDGSGVEDLVTTALEFQTGIALDVSGGKIYWTDIGRKRIQRSNLDGSGVEDLVTSGLRGPTGIALDVSGGKMYWADAGPRGQAAKIQRSNLDGTGVENLITTGFGFPFSIALGIGAPVNAGSDLVVRTSVSENTLTPGQSFTLRATVRNQGNASSASTTLQYYRSSNATISSSDTEVGTDGVNSLSAGGTSAESISLNAPSSAGTYYYGACVDNVSGESNTGNNCSSGVSVTVSGSGGGARACTAGLVVKPGEECNYKNGTFFVNSSGIGIILSGGLVMTSGNSHNQRGLINGVRWNFRASKNSGSNSWTIHVAN